MYSDLPLCLGLSPSCGSAAAGSGRRTGWRAGSGSVCSSFQVNGSWGCRSQGRGWAELMAAADTQLDLFLHWLCPSGRPSLNG